MRAILLLVTVAGCSSADFDDVKTRREPVVIPDGCEKETSDLSEGAEECLDDGNVYIRCYQPVATECYTVDQTEIYFGYCCR